MWNNYENIKKHYNSHIFDQYKSLYWSAPRWSANQSIIKDNINEISCSLTSLFVLDCPENNVEYERILLLTTAKINKYTVIPVIILFLI